MAKMLKPRELLEIVAATINNNDSNVDSKDPGPPTGKYYVFIEMLARAVVTYHGGTVGSVSWDDDDGVLVGFRLNSAVAPDGHPYEKYDPDVSWVNGEEI